jgi:NTP pyrophosphatase (non-canonical NTP hydrolase)
MSATEVRPQLQAFAEAMERKLRLKDGRKQWQDYKAEGNFAWFLCRLQRESVELLNAIASGDMRDIRDEAVDVANFCMMIYDTAEALSNEDHDVGRAAEGRVP